MLSLLPLGFKMWHMQAGKPGILQVDSIHITRPPMLTRLVQLPAALQQPPNAIGLHIFGATISLVGNSGLETGSKRIGIFSFQVDVAKVAMTGHQ